MFETQLSEYDKNYDRAHLTIFDVLCKFYLKKTNNNCTPNRFKKKWLRNPVCVC